VSGEEEVAVLIPAMRHQLLAGLVANIEATTPEPHRIYVMTNRERCARALEGLDVTLWRDRLRPWGHRLNSMYRRTTEPYLFLGADDVRFHPRWLAAAMGRMRQVDGVVAVNDLLNPAGTLALVSRRYLDEESGCMDRPRTVIFPGYRHNFSETELFWTARRRGRFAYAGDAVVEHLHFSRGPSGIPHDEVYALGGSSWGHDETLYNSRRHLFGG
jgi:hypothetical protein